MFGKFALSWLSFLSDSINIVSSRFQSSISCFRTEWIYIWYLWIFSKILVQYHTGFGGERFKKNERWTKYNASVPIFGNLKFIFLFPFWFLIPIQLQGHLYIHNVTLDENTYEIVEFLPSGDYMLRAFYYAKLNGKEHLLFETETHCEIKSTGLFHFMWWPYPIKCDNKSVFIDDNLSNYNYNYNVEKNFVKWLKLWRRPLNK